MANKILWAVESSATLLTTELNNLANTATAIDGADYDNGTNKFQYADFLLYLIAFDGAPTAGGYFELHLFYRHDGTHYADGEAGDLGGVKPSGATLHGVFPVDVTNAEQYIQLLGVPLSPFVFRAAVTNKCGQGLTAVDTNWLKIYPYDPEIQ